MALLPLQSDLVYGPVQSRRLGASLGVNILPAHRKICNFNCAYCQYGWTRERGAAIAASEWPAPAGVADAVREALQALRITRGKVDHITLAGNGEPTLHPGFAEIVERLRVVRDREWPGARLAVLSNGGTIARPDVLAALKRIDAPYVKLDTADPLTFRKLNGAARGLAIPIDQLRTLPHLTIQSLFTRDDSGVIDNTTPAALAGWTEALKRIRPMSVHVYSLDRAPAWGRLQVIPRSELELIAARVRAEGIHAEVF
jgi:wyosine [tRNA(Phe)-imidazoG37] synthetase (radical SAM superfamily)